MLEIEMKFRVADFDAVTAMMNLWEAKPREAHVESDHYHNAPDRDFAKTDEAFRLRRIGPRSIVTYKGPKQPGPTKTRTELEVPLAEGDAAAEMFLRLLGELKYRPTAVVRKTRREYSFERDLFSLQVCLDEVDGIGRFVEVEIVAAPPERDAAQAVLLRVVAELGLTNPEPRAYLLMVFAQGRPLAERL